MSRCAVSSKIHMLFRLALFEQNHPIIYVCIPGLRYVRYTYAAHAIHYAYSRNKAGLVYPVLAHQHWLISDPLIRQQVILLKCPLVKAILSVMSRKDDRLKAYDASTTFPAHHPPTPLSLCPAVRSIDLVLRENSPPQFALPDLVSPA